MMNGEFVSAQANAMAAGLEKNFKTTNEQVRNAFLWVYGRPATAAEIQASAKFFKEYKPSQAPPPPTSAVTSASTTEPDDPKGVEFYESKIHPILTENCFKCHSGRRAKGGLALDSKSALLQGGNSGPAINKDKTNTSLLLKAVPVSYTHLTLPTICSV